MQETENIAKITTGKKIAILQSNYIPWKGYFDLINQVDEFIIYDDMQYTKRDWRNRNLIKSSNGLLWLTIPVKQHGKRYQTIAETEVADSSWAKKHWQSLIRNYARSKYFKLYKDQFETIYLTNKHVLLSKINYQFIVTINEILNISTTLSWSSDYTLSEGKSERLLALCQASHANEYISGPAAKDYIDETVFSQADMKLNWMDYSGYPEYHQLHPPFEHKVSILDLIFNHGPNAASYMKSFPTNR